MSELEKEHEQAAANIYNTCYCRTHAVTYRTHGLESGWEKTENKPKPLKNKGPIQQTMSPQCLALQLLLGSLGTTTVEGTGWVLVTGERNGDWVEGLHSPS